MKCQHPAPPAVKKVWAKVPLIQCRGLCSSSCGPILMSQAEYDLLRKRGHPFQPVKGCMNCPLLKEERCSAYSIRPLICRLWGVVDKPAMKCPHGCVPERYLSDLEGTALLTEMEQAGGSVPDGLLSAVLSMLPPAVTGANGAE